MSLLRIKSFFPEPHAETGLRRCLTAVDLTLLGIGAIIGAGIFVLTGIAAATHAGPAIIVSYLLAGLACAFAALSYAELAASVGGCGSAYGYAYVGLGEFVAWLIGWDLLLEYGVSCSAVAVGWSGYANNVLNAMGFVLPATLLKGPFENGIVNLPAFLIVAVLSLLLAIGIKQSARFNALMVLIKLFAITVFILIAVRHVNPANWQPFMPFGWGGTVGGAALIFFAYIGFDAVSTAAEETIHPQRNLPIGIIASLVICTLIYIAVSGLLTSVTSYTALNVTSPVAQVLLNLGHRLAAAIVGVGALAGLTTVILVMYYGLTRVFLAMARDGLLPEVFAKIHSRTQTPVRIILMMGAVMAIAAGLFPMETLASLVNIGTLSAFCLVCGGVIVLRYKRPEMPRPFRTPFSPLVPLLGITFCLYLMLHLSLMTWVRLLIWMLIGLLVYFGYSRRHSLLAMNGRIKT